MAHELTIPTNADELRDMLHTPAVMRELMSDPEKFAEFTENSINARLKKDPEILRQVTEQTEKFKIEWLREQQGDTNAIAHRLNLDNPNSRAKIRPSTLYNKNAIGAKHDDMFNTPSEFLHTISEHGYRDASVVKKLNTLRNDLSSVKPSDGGFLIPEILRAELLRVGLEMSIVRSRARVIPMDSLTVPFPTVDSTSNVSSVYGGITGYWTEEGATLTESQPRFGRVELRANKLTLYTEVPNELIMDARPALDAFLNDIFPEAISWFEDVAFFVGGGVGEPLGFLNAPCAISVTRAGASNIAWDDFANAYSRMLPQSLGRAVWVTSPEVLPELLTAVIPGGGPIVSPVTSGTADPGLSPVGTVLGRPLLVSEKAKQLGTAGDLNFVDFGYYLLGDRQAMSARQSEDFRFQNDVTAFRVIERLDGRPWLAEAITPQNAGDTLSPFVKVAA